MFSRGAPSHATVVAYLALIVAVGTGGAYAAGKIGAKDIKQNAVRGKHVKNNTLKARDVDKASLGLRVGKLAQAEASDPPSRRVLVRHGPIVLAGTCTGGPQGRLVLRSASGPGRFIGVAYREANAVGTDPITVTGQIDTDDTTLVTATYFGGFTGRSGVSFTAWSGKRTLTGEATVTAQGGGICEFSAHALAG